jgi:tetratricopeptide (TPR) repeat protein
MSIYAGAVFALVVIAATALLLKGRFSSTEDTRSSGAIQVRSVPVAHRGTSDRLAHEHYLKGRADFESLSPDRIKTAGEEFQAAIDRDSLYADAWAGLSDIHSTIGVGNYAPSPPRPEFEQARFAASQALRLDSTLAEAHASMALVQMMYDYDWKGAERSLDKAQAYDPGYENAYQFRSFLLSWLGKFDSANVMSRQASHMNPSASRLHLEIGRNLIQAHRFDDAEKELEADVKADPRNGRGRLLLGETLLALGKLTDAVRVLDESQRLLPTATRVTAFRLSAYQAAGRHQEARHLLDSLVTLSDRSFVPAVDIAIGYAGMGDSARTLTWLENAYTDRTLRPFFRDPIFDFIKSNPRYGTLLSKLHLER